MPRSLVTPCGPWQLRHLIESICREGRMPGMSNESEYVRWMTEAGFQISDTEDVSAQVTRTWPSCAWRFRVGLLRRPSYVRFLLAPCNDNRIFAVAMLRLWMAYGIHAMRYVIFTPAK